MDICVASPEGYQPDAQIVSQAKEDARTTGAKVEVVSDPVVAMQAADVVITDVWASMGQEAELGT